MTTKYAINSCLTFLLLNNVVPPSYVVYSKRRIQGILTVHYVISVKYDLKNQFC